MDRREEEIERLNEMLKGGRPPEALAAEGTKHTNERVMAHLNIQVGGCALGVMPHRNGLGVMQIGMVTEVVVVRISYVNSFCCCLGWTKIVSCEN